MCGRPSRTVERSFAPTKTNDTEPRYVARYRDHAIAGYSTTYASLPLASPFPDLPTSGSVAAFQGERAHEAVWADYQLWIDFDDDWVADSDELLSDQFRVPVLAGLADGDDASTVVWVSNAQIALNVERWLPRARTAYLGEACDDVRVCASGLECSTYCALSAGP